ncbi:MAG: heavy metal translocating P-type ATPase [Deltaproteobacteria bacterium]|nr:heavy metal translocating P-type ATPase [Deltaproteobacteria bacterium]
MSSCFHCALPIPAGVHYSSEIGGETRHFCCNGCLGVCRSIFEAGLEGFYERTPEKEALAPPPDMPDDLRMYDMDDVVADYVESDDKGKEVNLLVEGMHCAACVWLIEKTLVREEEVISARVNLSNRRLKILWTDNKLKLSHIIKKLSHVGYSVVPYDPQAAEGMMAKEKRSYLFKIAFAGFAMMNLLWTSVALYSGADEGEFRNFFHWIGFALATPTLFYSGHPFIKGALNSLKRLHLNMDLPIAIGALTTYLYSTYITINNSVRGEVYFDTVVTFIFVILIGRYLEMSSRDMATSATQRLLDLQPKVATVIREGKEELVPIKAVLAGDRVVIKPGEKVPVDGIIVEGESSIDESMLTGESLPAGKSLGDKVAAGTLNTTGALIVEVEKTGKETSLSRIIGLVENAQMSKAPVQRITDRIVPWFVAVTIGLAIVTFFYWLGDGNDKALMAATSVLIITCPCALGLATPMAVSVASGVAARKGLLIKEGKAIEMLSKTSHFVFDKTGTITEGRMSVASIIDLEGVGEEKILALAATLERSSEHTIARGIIEEAGKRNIDPFKLPLENFNSRPGCGVTGKVEGLSVSAGSLKWMIEEGQAKGNDINAQAEKLESKGLTPILISTDNKLVGIISLSDTLRDDAEETLNTLRKSVPDLTLLSGDRQGVAHMIAEKVGGMNVMGELLPEDKSQKIEKIQQNGNIVTMVGDGVNDAPSLIRADVGIAIGSGTDVSIESADIVLMTNHLKGVQKAYELSKNTVSTIKQNISISLVYNLIMIPLAMMALVTPVVAAIAMPISSLLVIGNAARLRVSVKD